VTPKPTSAPAKAKKPQVPAAVVKPAKPKAATPAAKVVKAAKPAPAKRPPPAEGTFTWHNLQEALRDASTAKEVQEIMQAEIDGPARLRWLLRIQGRLQILRNDEELTYIESIAKG
jgi:hypothetical protein